MSYQWKIVATNPASGRDVCLYVTELEHLARQEWEATKAGESGTNLEDFRLLRRKLGAWKVDPDA